MIFLCNLQCKRIKLIKVENISKSYNHLNALSDVSFTLYEGEIIGLLGVNGAGKSTLMKILSGIIRPDSGTLDIFGETYEHNSIRLKKQIGYLGEDNPLYGDMYVYEYLEYIVGVYNLDKAKIHSIIEEVGLTKECGKKISTLSRGNRQRVGIAQAIIHNPRFLILDEVTGGLDPNQKESLYHLIKKIAKDKVILLSTHILGDVKEICSRFILINEGKVLADKKMKDIDSLENTFFELTNENNSR